MRGGPPLSGRANSARTGIIVVASSPGKRQPRPRVRPRRRGYNRSPCPAFDPHCVARLRESAQASLVLRSCHRARDGRGRGRGGRDLAGPVAVAAAVPVGAAATAPAGELVVLMRPGAATWFVGPEGAPAGFDVDLIRRFADEQRLPLRLVVAESATALTAGISRAKAHVGAGGIFRPRPATAPKAPARKGAQRRGSAAGGTAPEPPTTPRAACCGPSATTRSPRC